MANLSYQERVDRVKNLLDDYPDFPKKGVLFRDIFPVMRNPEVFRDLIALMVEQVRSKCPNVEAIVGLEARGFIFGPMMAEQLNVAFVPVRKKGKLPGEVVQVSYTKEYGTDVFEVQKNALKPGQKVVIVDDLLATGGTLVAAVDLMKKVQAETQECLVVIELADLKGRDKVKEDIFALITLTD